MDTIQLQCGSCGQMMAISTAHLGSQVQCPHCQAIVQAPPPQASNPPGAAFQPHLPTLEVQDRESIFGQPEPTDDLFDAEPAPRVEMPRMELQPAAPPVSPYAATVTMEQAPIPQEYMPAPSPQAAAAYESEPEEDIAPVTSRRVPKTSTLIPNLLIFLVPYAIFTTLFIAYLLYTWPRQRSPLELLPDNSQKGQPRLQVKHDSPIDADMKVALGRSIRVGDIEVTPLKVKHTSHGDLVLVYRAKNVSSNLTFNPVSIDYLKYSSGSMAAGRPYTYLERHGEKDTSKRMYGGDLEWLQGPPGREQPFEGDIGPGQEATIHLISEPKQRRMLVPRFLNTTEPLVWRIQVRRGLIPVEGKMVSATTVIGVDFTSRDIVRGEAEDEG